MNNGLLENIFNDNKDKLTEFSMFKYAVADDKAKAYRQCEQLWLGHAALSNLYWRRHDD